METLTSRVKKNVKDKELSLNFAEFVFLRRSGVAW